MASGLRPSSSYPVELCDFCYTLKVSSHPPWLRRSAAGLRPSAYASAVRCDEICNSQVSSSPALHTGYRIIAVLLAYPQCFVDNFSGHNLVAIKDLRRKAHYMEYSIFMGAPPFPSF